MVFCCLPLPFFIPPLQPTPNLGLTPGPGMLAKMPLESWNPGGLDPTDTWDPPRSIETYMILRRIFWVTNRLVFVWIPAPKHGVFVGYSCWNRASTSYTSSCWTPGWIFFISPSTKKNTWAFFCWKKGLLAHKRNNKNRWHLSILISIEIYWNIHPFFS